MNAMIETGLDGSKKSKRASAESVIAPERPAYIPKDLRELIAKQPFFKGITASQIKLLADAAMVEEFERDEVIFTEGDPANRFYVILKGRVLLESETPERGMIPIQTLEAGDDLGWSWLFQPFYLHFSARALEPTKVIFFYGTRLHEQSEADPVLGYALMKRVASAMLECIKAMKRELSKRAGKR